MQTHWEMILKTNRKVLCKATEIFKVFCKSIDMWAAEILKGVLKHAEKFSTTLLKGVLQNTEMYSAKYWEVFSKLWREVPQFVSKWATSV